VSPWPAQKTDDLKAAGDAVLEIMPDQAHADPDKKDARCKPIKTGGNWLVYELAWRVAAWSPTTAPVQ